MNARPPETGLTQGETRPYICLAFLAEEGSSYTVIFLFLRSSKYTSLVGVWMYVFVSVSENTRGAFFIDLFISFVFMFLFF